MEIKQKQPRILVVDDDDNILQLVKMRMESENYRVEVAPAAKQALSIFEQKDFDLAIVDLKLNGIDGIQLMEHLHQLDEDIPVIILTAHGSIKSAVKAMTRGACTYLTKPFDHKELLLQIKSCMEKSALSQEVARLKNLVQERYGFENIVTGSEKMRHVLDRVAQAAKSDSAVFVLGESGTGKELIVKNLHLASQRSAGPFVAINCSAIPDTLIESVLFGHVKGAFTGADRDKKGLFAEAHGGTFFLDEIAEMPMSMQAKLLRVLEEKTVHPVGGNQPRKVDMRIVSASNRDLPEAVSKGEFREDLFYRINVIAIELPPLRQRKEDIPLLAEHFLEKYTAQINRTVRGFTRQAAKKMLDHDWPGNVRELENAVHSAVAMAVEPMITADLILPTAQTEDQDLKSLRHAKQDFERDYLIQLLEFTRGNITKASQLAGKYRADLYELLRRYGLDPKDFRRK